MNTDDPGNVKESLKKPHGIGGPVENIFAQKHGGGAANDAVRKGEAFHGLAAEREIDVRLMYETDGPGAVILRNAIRLQVVSELYYDAISKAAQAHDQAKLETALHTWGWVTNSAVRAWDLVRRELKKDDGTAAKTIIDQYREVTDDTQNS